MAVRIGNWAFMSPDEAQFHSSSALFETPEALASYCGILSRQAEDLFSKYGYTVAAVPQAHMVHADTARRVVPAQPLRDIKLPPKPAQKPQAVPEPEPWFEVLLLADDGSPLVDVQLEIADDWNFKKTGRTDGDGRLHLTTQLEATHTVTALQPPIRFPEPAKEPVKVKGFSFARDGKTPITLSSNKPHILVVTRPRATVVSVDGWWEGQSVMIFQTARTVEPDVVVTVRGILRTALLSGRGGEVHIVGHTDTEGKASDNEALALERARSVHFFLTGKRQEWADHAFANANVATLQAALSWAAKTTEVQCDPGPVDGDWGPATALGLSGLREHAGISQDQPLGADDWAAIYDLFDEDLALFMMTNRDGLNAMRAKLKFVNPVAKGERFPVDAPELDEHESPANRRVDIVLCASGAVPEPESDEIYDGTFLLEHLAVAPEVTVRIRIVNTGLTFLGWGMLQAKIGRLGPRLLIADPTGLIEITVLGDDFIEIDSGTDALGRGYTMAINFPELIAGDLV